MAESRARALISGRVQGVSFRYYTYHEALKLGLNGWVRNLWDGRVEAEFQGEKADIERMLEWCEHGPPAAKVEVVEVDWNSGDEQHDEFNVRPTANVGEPA